MAHLLIKHFATPILHYPLNGHPLSIGRDPSCDVQLLGDHISRHHARLNPTPHGYQYQNLGRNGSRRNGKVVTDALLRPGDVVALGEWSLELCSAAQCGETVIPAATVSTASPSKTIIGNDPGMQRVLSTIAQLAASSAPVCILGESGTGKELVADAIHQQSPRAAGTLVAINCGALPPSMIESELFGFEKGSFTGALQQRKGLLEQAHNGTLFLDEVGELPLELQTRFLRVLETGTLRRIGGQHDVRVDVRIISATHRNLSACVEAGTFREDLFFRLFVLPLQLPALRDRPNDIPLLCQHFAQLFGRAEVQFTAEALARLTTHNWPGNVRELKNTIQRSLILTPVLILDAAHIQLLQPSTPVDRPVSLDDQECLAIRRALTQHAGNNTRAAAVLGISRTTLVAKIKKYNLESAEFRKT